MEALRLIDILARPVFQGCQVVAGELELYRPIRWVHILDVTRAGHLVDGGELILTTGAGFKDIERDFHVFIRDLVKSGAAALCIELGTHVESIPKGVVEYANEVCFPILVFPFEVRFLEITQDIHNLIFQQQHKRLIQERQIFYEQEEVEKLLHGEPGHFGAAGGKLGQRFTVVVLGCPEGSARKVADETLIRNRVNLYHTIRLAFHKERMLPHLSIRPNQVTVVIEHNYKGELSLRTHLEQVMQNVRDACESHVERDGYLPCGVGKTATDISQIPDSYEAARIARSLASSTLKKDVVFYDELGIYRWLHLLKGQHDAEDILSTDLASVIQYDREYHTDLLHTLKVYLDCDRSKQLTADRLFIHRQTLYHRLETLERILQVDLDDPTQRLSVHLSLYLLAQREPALG